MKTSLFEALMMCTLSILHKADNFRYLNIKDFSLLLSCLSPFFFLSMTMNDLFLSHCVNTLQLISSSNLNAYLLNYRFSSSLIIKHCCSIYLSLKNYTKYVNCHEPDIERTFDFHNFYFMNFYFGYNTEMILLCI